MVVGYCRTSKTSQELALQKDALEKYGVDHIYTEQMSGVKQRPVLEGVLSELNAGDTLVVWKLDRLGRTSKELVNMIDDFERRGINFVSITEQFDTTTPTGKFVVTMFIAMAQLEIYSITEDIRKPRLFYLSVIGNAGAATQEGSAPDVENCDEDDLSSS